METESKVVVEEIVHVAVRLALFVIGQIEPESPEILAKEIDKLEAFLGLVTRAETLYLASKGVSIE